MIQAVYGIPGLTVLELVYFLRSESLSHGVVGNTLAKWEGKHKVAPYPVVFPSLRKLRSVEHKFKAPVVALVVDCPYVLSSVQGLTLLGAKVDKTNVNFQPFVATDLKKALKQLKGRPVSLAPVPVDYVPAVLKKFRGSSLGGLQTLMYKVKDKEVRAKVNVVVRDYFLTGQPLAKTKRSLSSLVGGSAFDGLVTLLGSEGCKNLQRAVVAVKDNPSKLKAAARKNKVSPFDVKYILSVR